MKTLSSFLLILYMTTFNRNSGDASNVSFSYTLWLGTNITEKYTLYMEAPSNASFYHAMQLAAAQNPMFKFEADSHPTGHYVHTIAGLKEEPLSYHFWLFYSLIDFPDPTSPPALQLVSGFDVDDIVVRNGKNYLFWYKKL